MRDLLRPYRPDPPQPHGLAKLEVAFWLLFTAIWLASVLLVAGDGGRP